jgi:hypothetical protein
MNHPLLQYYRHWLVTCELTTASCLIINLSRSLSFFVSSSSSIPLRRAVHGRPAPDRSSLICGCLRLRCQALGFGFVLSFLTGLVAVVVVVSSTGWCISRSRLHYRVTSPRPASLDSRTRLLSTRFESRLASSVPITLSGTAFLSP